MLIRFVHVQRRPPRSEAKGVPTDKPFDPNDKYRDVIQVTFPKSEVEQPFFQIIISLPSAAYFRLIETDWTKNVLILSVESEAMGRALVYGGGPAVRDIEWRVDIEKHVFLKEVRLHFLSRGDQDNQANEKTAQESAECDEGPPLIEEMLAATERTRVAIAILRISVIKCTLVLAVVVLIASIIK